MDETKKRKITVAGMGYVGLSNAVLLSRNHSVTALDIIEDRVELINRRQSPIRDAEIEDYLENRTLDLAATTNAEVAYRDAEFVIVATPTNYDSEKKLFRHLVCGSGRPAGDRAQSGCGDHHQIHGTRWVYRKRARGTA